MFDEHRERLLVEFGHATAMELAAIVARHDAVSNDARQQARVIVLDTFGIH